MSENIKDGGSAFPLAHEVPPAVGYERAIKVESGMTLRDYFAAKALAAMISQPGKAPENCGKKAVPRLAKFAYEYADAMLAAREVQS